MSDIRLRTRLTQQMGIERPILCGGLMWLATAEYVAACVNAGAMGYITPRSYPDLAAFEDALERCAALTGGTRFGVNLYISARPEQNESLSDWIALIERHKIGFVETAGYSPAAFLPRLKDAGCHVMHKATSLRHAAAAARAGADAVTLIGAECGGHPGQGDISAMVLGARALDEIEVPVLIGGGIGSGRQIAAALAMGVSGVLMGTRMLVADEIWAHRDYKRHITGLDETASTTVLHALRNTYRCLTNEAAAEVQALEAQGVRDYETLRPLIGGAAQKRAYETGDWSQGILSLGPAAGFADRLEPVAAILERLTREAAEALRAAPGLVTQSSAPTSAPASGPLEAKSGAKHGAAR